MSTIDYIAAIIVLLIIFLFIAWVIFFVIKFIKEASNAIGDMAKRRSNVSSVPASSPMPTVRNKSEEEILADPDFKRTVEYFRPHWRWMTLAGGTDPILNPQISFSSDGTIFLIKEGDDLGTSNWRDYKNGTVWSEREKALERFAVDLFGEYAGKLNISTEYIADHLIKFENSTASASNYTLTFSFPGNLKTSREQDLFIRELRFGTPIFLKS